MPHPSLLERKIIHFDMDAFYASVEVRDNPSLAGKPLVVGGSPQSRGVVCTASYEARKFGVRSAMACATAYRLCPDAIFVPPNFDRYAAISKEIREIFGRYTAIIEPLSLDEAYLDVTLTTRERGLYATQIAKRIQDDIISELGLSGSAGVAPNKLVAKIASDINKPKGITVVPPEHVLKFMGSLPLRKIHGIGPATEKRLQKRNFHYCRDLWSWSESALEEELGNMGPWLYKRVRGIDERAVAVHRERKSIGKEDTFAVDILELAALDRELVTLCEKLEVSLRKRSLLGKTIVLKVKYSDFTLLTRSQTIGSGTDSASEILEVARGLMRVTEAGRKKVRLLGVSLSNLSSITESFTLGSP
ncbi:MAG: DNA polymerase IV [Chitinophagaceae bacterium]|nr:DNA polymerase IV [Oligoflexus sp.]